MKVSSKAGGLGICIAIELSAWTILGNQPPVQKRLPLPDKTAEAKAVKLIMDIFGDDLKRIKSPVGMNNLAEEMLVQARSSREAEPKDDPANRYVLYRVVGDLAARAGNADLALSAIDELARDFEIDALAMKAAALEKVGEANLGKDSAKALVEKILPLMHDAVDADNYEVAIKLGKVATKAAVASEVATLPELVAKRNAEVSAAQKNFARIQGFIDQLEKDPKDAEANFELGKYYALLKGRWEKGLPFLAKGGDNPLAMLAIRDLTQPKDAHEQLALADGWWSLAGKEKEQGGAVQLAYVRRAVFWYDKAEGQLAGLNRTKARKRMETGNVLLKGTAQAPVGPVGEIKKLMGHTDDVKGVAFSADGRYAVSGSVDTTVRVWDLETGKEVKRLKGHTKQVWAVAFYLGDRQVLSASWDETVRLWDVKNGNDIRRFTHRKDVNGLALSRDGNFMLTACDDRHVYLWSVATGKEVRTFPGHTDFVYCVAFSSDGRHFASGGLDRTVRIVELASGSTVRVLDRHTSSVHGVAFAPDGRSVFSCGDAAAHQWDLTTGKELRRFEHKNKTNVPSNVLAMALSSDGRRLYTGGDDKSIRIWDVDSGKQMHRFDGHTDTINSLALSPDGYRLLSGSLDRTVRLWGLPGR